MSVPRALYKAARTGSIGTLSTTTMLFIASLFTIFSGSLFQAQIMPNTDLGALKAEISVANHPGVFYTPEAAASASLILLGNLSYPSFTYEDLIFPQFVLRDVQLSTSDMPADANKLEIDAVLPAIRSRLDCNLYETSKHHFTITEGPVDDDRDYSSLEITIDAQECKDPGLPINVYLNWVSTNVTHIGKGGPPVPCFPPTPSSSNRLLRFHAMNSSLVHTQLWLFVLTELYSTRLRLKARRLTALTAVVVYCTHGERSVYPVIQLHSTWLR